MIDLEMGTMNGHDIDDLPSLPEGVVGVILESVVRYKEEVVHDMQRAWRLCDEARAIGATLDLILPIEGETWADRLEEASFMPPAKTVANGFGHTTDQMRENLTYFV